MIEHLVMHCVKRCVVGSLCAVCHDRTPCDTLCEEVCSGVTVCYYCLS